MEQIIPLTKTVSGLTIFTYNQPSSKCKFIIFTLYSSTVNTRVSPLGSIVTPVNVSGIVQINVDNSSFGLNLDIEHKRVTYMGSSLTAYGFCFEAVGY